MVYIMNISFIPYFWSYIFAYVQHLLRCFSKCDETFNQNIPWRHLYDIAGAGSYFATISSLPTIMWTLEVHNNNVNPRVTKRTVTLSLKLG